MSNENNIKVEANRLNHQDGRSIEFKFPVEAIVQLRGWTLVLLSIPQGTKFNENVFGISPAFELAWQVPPRDYVNPDAPYSAMRALDQQVRLFGWDSITVDVDPTTGKIVNLFFDR